MKKKKNKNKDSTFSILKIMAAILVAIILIWYIFIRDKSIVVKVVNKIDGYDYVLKNTSTKLYKDYYYELKELLEDENTLDEEKYAKLIAQLFVSDFYSLNKKISNQDVGGKEYIHTGIRNKFINQATSSVYKYVKNNINGKRKQKLPEVSDVEVLNIKEINYISDNNEYKDNNAYEVNVIIKYKKDMGYPQKLNLIIIHEDEFKLSIIETKKVD